MTYAVKTRVPAERTKAEIEALLRKHGADSFFSGWGKDKAFIAFRMETRNVKFELPIPDDRSSYSSEDRRMQVIRSRWRALLLVVKAKLEAVESGITTFEEEFLAHIQLPDGQTVGQWMKPQIAEAYSSGQMPLMLGPGGRP